MIYPFIVNDPGEAAQAKRRIGAVTLGHVPPPMKASETPQRLTRLEALLDEFSNADGLDPRRRDRLIGDIRAEAQALGVEADLGLDTASCPAEAITRIDRFVCDVKESQFGDGLHVWGRAPEGGGGTFDTSASVAGERQALLDALDGRRIAPGPSGSPWRGRTDVLPTGRNLFTTDPRSVPTRAAYRQGEGAGRRTDPPAPAGRGRLAARAGRRSVGLGHDAHGRRGIRDGAGASGRAAGLGRGSERVSGVEVLPIAELDRPRIDVTLRVSGLFRDVFPTLSALFQQAVRALARATRRPTGTPMSGLETARVYGPEPGRFGVGMGAHLGDYSERAARRGRGVACGLVLGARRRSQQKDSAGLHARVAGADAFVHPQDLPETDLLLAEDYAEPRGGLCRGTKDHRGCGAALPSRQHRPERPRARGLTEEIARVVQARAANPTWIAGMRRHGFRGGAEIAATLENMAAFAHLADVVPCASLRSLLGGDAGRRGCHRFPARRQSRGAASDAHRFAELHEAGLWLSRRNSILATLEAEA